MANLKAMMIDVSFNVEGNAIAMSLVIYDQMNIVPLMRAFTKVLSINERAEIH